MKTVLLQSVSCAALFFLASPAMAENPVSSAPSGGDWYVSVFTGGSSLQGVSTESRSSYYGYTYSNSYTANFSNGFVLGGTVGKRINENLRVEVELSYGRYKASSYSYDGYGSYTATGDLSATYLLANVWYDIPTSGKFTPYIGGGVGVARVTADTSFDGNPFGYGPGGTKLAFQVGAGFSYPVAKNMALDVGYRYRSVRGIDFDDNYGSGVFDDGDVNTHSLQVGLRIGF